MRNRLYNIMMGLSLAAIVLSIAVAFLRFPFPADSSEWLERFRLDFLEDRVGVMIGAFAVLNFAIAFAFLTPIARFALKHPLGKSRPQFIVLQYFVMSAFFYLSVSLLGFAYTVLRPTEHALSLLFLCALMSVGGLARLRLVDVPELETRAEEP